MQGQIGQAGVLGVADAVHDSGAAVMPQLQAGKLPTGSVGGESGEAVSARVGEAHAGAGMWALFADDEASLLKPLSAGSSRGPLEPSVLVQVLRTYAAHADLEAGRQPGAKKHE